MANIVEFKNVNMSFGNNKVLKDIDLEIEKGKFYTLLGPSGCGKSTLIKLLCRLYDPDKGVIKMNGVDIKKYNKGQACLYFGSSFFTLFITHLLKLYENSRN